MKKIFISAILNILALLSGGWYILLTGGFVLINMLVGKTSYGDFGGEFSEGMTISIIFIGILASIISLIISIVKRNNQENNIFKISIWISIIIPLILVVFNYRFLLL